MRKSPVLFLFFNREDTTLKVLEEIKKYEPEIIYLASDGPREAKEGEEKLVENLREQVLSKIDWNCRIEKRFLEKNQGCKNAVSSAISWFFDSEESGIILEDDCLPHQDFFTFTSEMLEKYKSDNRVMMVSGTNYLLDMSKQLNESYFFSRHFTIWGWATWRRAWNLYDIEMKNWNNLKNNKQHHYLSSNFLAYKHIEYTFELIQKDVMNTWDIQWVYTCLFQYGLCITPSKNLISNIGIEGTHNVGKTSDSLFLPTYNLLDKDIIHPNQVYPNNLYDNGILKKKNAKVAILITIKKFLKKIGLFRPVKFLKDLLC